MKYTFYADCHIGTKRALFTGLLHITKEQVERENAFYLGDNIDLHNCTEENYLYLLSKYTRIKEVFKNRFVSGNHELDINHLYAFNIKDKRFIFTHGDEILWGQAAIKYRKKLPAQGFGFFKNLFFNFHNKYVSSKNVEKLVLYAKQSNVDTIICAHLHVKNVFDEMVSGVRVIVLPRGKTEIEI